MSKKVEVNVEAIGFPSLLFIVFLTLKLCGVIAWSWWWVTAPLWVPTAIVLAMLAFVLFLAFLAWVLD